MEKKDLLKVSYIFVFLLLVLPLSFSVSNQWWNVSWHYRIPIEINMTDFDRVDFPIEREINFSGIIGNFDNNSIRVIEYNSSGNVLREIPSQFDPLEGYTSDNAIGEVVWIMNGTTSSNSKRIFLIYFDSTSNAKSSPSYSNSFNYTFSNAIVELNSSNLEIKIDTNRSERTSGIYYAKRIDSGTTLFNTPSNERTVEYLIYNNGTNLGFKLENNSNITNGPSRLKIVQKGNETVWNSLTETGEGKITKSYYIYPNTSWVKVKQDFENIGGANITRSSAFALKIEAERAFGMDSTTGNTTDPFSWQSTHNNSLGIGMVNINESVNNFFADADPITEQSVGIALSSINISSGSSISQTSLIYFNDQANHTKVQALRDQFAGNVNIEQNSSESYSVILVGSSDQSAYLSGEEAVLTVNISNDSINATSQVNLTLNMGTPSNSSDDVLLFLYDDGTHNDSSAGDKVFTTNYTFSQNAQIGTWNATARGYTSENEFLNQSSFTFSISSSSTALNLSLSPVSANISGINQTNGQNFTVNISVNNIGNGTGLNTNIVPTLPSNVIVNWSSSPSSFSCGNLSSGESCDQIFNITVSQRTLPDTYNVTFNLTWTNVDSSTNNTSQVFQAVVLNNSVLSVLENNISGNIDSGTSSIIGNLTINSSGNDNITSVNITCSSGVVCINFTTAFSQTNFSFIEPGDQEIVAVNVTVPSGFSAGNYTGIINVTSDNGFKEIDLNITVPSNDSWSISSANCSKTVLVNTTGNVCNLTLTNAGNQYLNFSISPTSANGTNVNSTNINLSGGSSTSIAINYNSTGLNESTYNSTYVLTSNGTPSNTSISISLTVAPGPTLTENTADQSQQLSSVLITVDVEDLSGTGIASVNVTVNRPDGINNTLSLTNQTPVTGTSTWAVNYTNTSARGTYNFTITAVDSIGGEGTTSSQFTVYSSLNVTLNTNWKDYFNGEISSINYNLTDGEGTGLSSNVTLTIYNSENNVIYLTNKTTGNNGKLDVVPTFTIPTDGSTGNYILNAVTSYYDSLANLTVTNNTNYTFAVHLSLSFEIDTSIVWYANNVLKIYTLIYGDDDISNEINNTDISLNIYDPASNLWFTTTKSNMTIVESDSTSSLYLAQYAIPTSPSMGIYLISGKIVQGSRNKSTSETFRISSGGPFDLVIEDIESEVAQGTDIDFTLRLENKGEVSLDVFLDYWISDSNNNTYDAVTGEAVFVGADSNRSVGRSLFVSSSLPLGTYTLNAKLNYSVDQPIIHTTRTFTVIQSTGQQESGSSGGGGSIIPSVSAAEINHELTITKLFPDVLDIDRGSIRYITLEILNTGNQDEKDVDVILEGIPSNWYFSERIDKIKKDESKTILIRITIPPSEERSENSVLVKAVSEKAKAEKRIKINIFESREELIKSLIRNTKELLKNVESTVSQIGRERIEETVRLLEQAQELIGLSEKNLEENNLLKSLDYIEKARNLLKQTEFLVSRQELSEEKTAFLFPQFLSYVGVIFLGLIAASLVLHTVHEINHRKHVRKIKKAIPQISIKKEIPQESQEEFVSEMLAERKKEINEVLELLKKQHQRGLITDETYMELSERYNKELYYNRIKTCNSCGYVNEKDSYYCVECGNRVSR